MQKVIGSIIVVTTCTVLGFEKSRELQLHLKELEELKKVFTLFRSEMQYTKATFSELFMKISKKLDGMYRCWFEELAKVLEHCDKGTFQEIWANLIEKHYDESKLTKEELESLIQIGNSLGYLETIDLYLEQLEISIQGTREELKNKKKLYQSMGIMCGIFLVIVLL